MDRIDSVRQILFWQNDQIKYLSLKFDEPVN